MVFKSNKIYNDHIIRVNKVLKYIDDNLDSDLTLKILSREAGYSSFYFHRMFKRVTNESLFSYIKRKRIEKIASILQHNLNEKISDLSFQYGYTSNSSFTRAFKKFYGVSPTQFRQICPGRYGRISNKKSKNGQQKEVFEKYICDIDNLKNWIKMNAKIEIKKLEKFDIAYVSHIGSKDVGLSFSKLYDWANSNHLFDNPQTKMIRIFHDSFKTTHPDKIRMSIGVTFDKYLDNTEDISTANIPEGNHIMGLFEITEQEFQKAWSSLFVWMNENGYKKAETNPFEIYHSSSESANKYKVELCIPIEE